jgi:hypothetical protein
LEYAASHCAWRYQAGRGEFGKGGVIASPPPYARITQPT